jgi:hypothetical protein
MKTRVAIGFVLALLSLAATGCSAAPNGAGSSGSSSGAGAGGGGAGAGTGATGSAPTQDIAEVEPNNGPDFAGMQSLGTFDADKTIKVTGRLDSGGFDGAKYTGDYDAFWFEVSAAGGSLTPTIDWTGTADVDAILYDANLSPVASDTTATTKPISKGGPIPAGKYALVLFSKDLAADWTMTLAYAKTAAGSSSGGSSSGGSSSGGSSSGGTTCIDSATLTGGYWQKMHGGLEEIRFNDDGSVDYGSALPASGTIWDKGTWNLACPTLATQLNTQASITFTVNGTRLVDQTGVAWVRCTPVSSGECF